MGGTVTTRTRLAQLAAVLALVLSCSWPAAAQVVCAGSGCGGGGTVTSPVATDPLTFSGALTLDNAANTPLVCSDGLQDSTLTAGRVTFAGASGRLSDDADLTFATDTVTATKVNVKAGTGTGTLSVGGVICKSATPVATTGTAEQILATCPIPAGALSANGSHIEFVIEAVTAANTNSKTLKVYLSASGGGLGGSVCYTSPASTSNNEVWLPGSIGIMSPMTATSGRCSFNLWRGPKGGSSAITSMAYFTDALAQTWANALEFVIAGTPTVAGDLTLNGYTVQVVQ